MKKILLLSVFLLSTIIMNAQGWGQTQKIVPDDRALGDEFGYSVAMQGEYAIISAPQKSGTTSSRNGAVYVFKMDTNGDWIQEQLLQQSTPRQFDEFGKALAIDGNYLIVGCRTQDYDENEANYINDAPGAAYIFEKDGSGNWSQTQKLVGTDRASLDVFGDAVDISGNYAIVSAPWEDEDENDLNTMSLAGSAFIFERDPGGVWQRVQKIVASDRKAGVAFGEGAVAIDGNYIAIGVFRELDDATGGNPLGSAGAVYIFERDGSGTWSEVQKIVASDRAQGEWFGYSVSLDGNHLLVGSNQNNNFTGAAYVFEKDGNDVWNEVQKLTASNGVAGDRFGQDTDMDGNRIIIGAHFRDIGSPGDDGAAYIFEKEAGIWTETAFIYDAFNSTSEYFGFSVGISGDYALVGIYRDDEDENEQNYIQLAGATFIFDANEPNTLSVIENDFSSSLKAYPNPTDGDLSIDFNKHFQQIDISVYNILGQQVYTQKFYNSESIELQFNLPKGMYLVEVKTDANVTSVLKIIKH